MDALIKLIGANVRKIRKAKGLSQQKLGERASFDYRYIGFIEQARVNPTIKTLEKVASALNVTVRDLFPANSEIEANKKGLPAKISDRERVISIIMRDLNKADNTKLKQLRRIIKITVGTED